MSKNHKQRLKRARRKLYLKRKKKELSEKLKLLKTTKKKPEPSTDRS